MKASAIYLFRRLRRQTSESEVEEELCFHLEMLAHDFRRKGMTAEAANAASRERFGDLEIIRRQCQAINRRKNPVVRALKSALVVMFIAGLLLRILSMTPQFGRLADLSMAIGILGQLFLHLRGLLPASFRWPGPSNASLFDKFSNGH